MVLHVFRRHLRGNRAQPATDLPHPLGTASMITSLISCPTGFTNALLLITTFSPKNLMRAKRGFRGGLPEKPARHIVRNRGNSIRDGGAQK